MVDMSEEKIIEFPKALFANQIDPIDVLILNELSVGKSRTTLAEELKKEYGIDITRTEVEKRIDTLEKKQVILSSAPTIITNPIKLFDHIFLNWLKLPLRPLLRRDELTWKRASERIIEISKKYGEMIMMLFTPEGEGEYDLVAFVCTNDLRRYYEFLEELTKEELIEKSKTQRVHVPSMFYFNPRLLPSFESYKQLYLEHKKRIEQMRSE
jgi:DNA-binding Lrp family transcriptional regulator